MTARGREALRSSPSPRRSAARRVMVPGVARPSDLLLSFFAAAIGALLLAAGTGIAYAMTGLDRLHWTALHLALLGGVSQLVVGAGQFFSCAFLATDPPSRRMIGAQLLAWNAGTALVAVGEPTAITLLVDAGGLLLAIGLVLFAISLRDMQRRSLQRARWALRWYQACAVCLGLGGLLGLLLARDTPWPQGSLLGAHLALTLGGWLGTAIIGTLHTFFPSLTATTLHHPRLQGPTFTLWLLGVGELALGAAIGADAVIAAGWVALLLAAGLLEINLLASLRGSSATLALPARLIALAQTFLPAGLLLALMVTLVAGGAAPFVGPARSALAALLLVGWIGLTVAGSLLHLLAILARVRSFARALPASHPALDRPLTAAAAIGVGGLALSHAPGLGTLATPAGVVLAAIACLLATRVGILAISAARPIRPTA
jgi:nitrite reductase (NO-forming)